MTTTTTTTLNISKETLAIFKNFSSINSNLLVKEGNQLATISPLKNILTKATVDETFPSQFGIWDLGKFLGTVSLFENPTFEFNNNHVIVSNSGRSSVKYYYSDPALLTVPTKELTMPDPVVTFVLTEKKFIEAQKAASVLQVPDMAITNEGDKLCLVVLDKSDPSSNKYSIELGDLSTGANFCFYFKAENLKLLSGNYDVEISEKVVSQFSHKDINLQYWIALESDSSYDG
jgi:hypothetical protein